MTGARVRTLVPRARAVLGVAGALCALGLAAACASAPRGAREVALVQVVHRAARLPGGALDPTAVAAAADAVALELTGEALPLDAWAALAPRRRGRAVTVLALPGAGPLAEAVRARLALGGAVELAEGQNGTPLVGEGGPIVVVLAPGAAAVEPPPAVRAAVVLADLLEPEVNGTPWKADTVVGSRDAAAVLAAAEYVLTARARGAVPDWSALAARRGLDPARVRWTRRALH